MRRLLDKLFRRLGFVVRRNNLYSRTDWRLRCFLEHHKIDTVLDVGANKGQFAMELLAGGFKGRIISFEALPDVYEELQNNARPYGERWTIAPRCALSDEEGVVQFYVTKLNASSSMLKPAELTSDMPEFFSVMDVIDVDSHRLDALVKTLAIGAANIFLKLDVQGGEKKVLDGATELLPAVKGLNLEMSLQPLYDGQVLAKELNEFLTQQGFTFWDFETVFRNPENGRLIQYDGVYFRA